MGVKWKIILKEDKRPEEVMFTGQYQHAIDSKGRLIMPVKFREKFKDSCYVCNGLDGCLFVFDKEYWEEFNEKLMKLPMNNKKARTLARYFASGSDECEFDKQGRILISPALKEKASLTRDVVLVGVLNRVEIWDADKWNETISDDEVNIDDLMEDMSDSGFDISF